jgi:hypothetical protein
MSYQGSGLTILLFADARLSEVPVRSRIILVSTRRLAMTHTYRVYDPLNEETILPWRTLSTLDGVFGCAKLYVSGRLPDGAKVRLSNWPGDPRARRLEIESSDEARVEPALLHYVKVARLSFERV